MVQEAEEGHRDDKETGLVRLQRRARQQQETGRAGKNWCVVPWSPIFTMKMENDEDDEHLVGRYSYKLP